MDFRGEPGSSLVYKLKVFTDASEIILEAFRHKCHNFSVIELGLN